MATCEKKQPIPVSPPVEYVLRLDCDEAAFLRALLGNNIVGPTDGPRRFSTRIYDALERAGTGGLNFRVESRQGALWIASP